MVYKDNDVCQSRLVVKRIDDGVPENHKCRFIKKFVKDKCSYLDEENYNSQGRASYRKSSLMSIVVFAHFDDVFTGFKMSEKVSLS